MPILVPKITRNLPERQVLPAARSKRSPGRRLPPISGAQPPRVLNGPIYKLSIGTKLYVIVSSPILVKEIVRDDDIVFANRNPSKASLAFSYGGEGYRLRASRAPVVDAANLGAFRLCRRREVVKSTRDLCIRARLPVKVGEVGFRTVINMITCMFWGGTLGEEEAARIGAEFREAVARLTALLGKPNVSDFFPVIARFDLQGVEREMEAVAWIGRIFDFVIRQRMSSEELGGKGCERRDFLQFLLEYKDEEAGRSITPEQIKALLMDIVIGGADTTSTMVEWTMTELLLHPQVLLKVQKELDDIVGLNNMVEEFHIHKLPYLHMVVKETLRLHPVAPLLLPRSPSRTRKVGKYC